jgi:Transposase IS116/IS110/IS902 family/Phage integrase family
MSEMRTRNNASSLRALRDHAIIALLVGCGLRRAQVVALRLEEFPAEGGRWFIADLIGKGGHVRTVPVPAGVKNAVDRATGLANHDAGSSSVGEDTIAITAHVAGHCAQSRLATRPWTVECSGPERTAGLASAALSSQRRNELFRLYGQLQKRTQELDKEVEAQARQRPQARRLLTHPGVGPVTALATEVFLGDPSRFTTGNQVASYIEMIPCEHSSGKRQRLGKMTKEGNSLLRYLWTEATMHAVGKDPELKRFYRRKLIQKGMGKARIAAARKLGIRLWIMMRDQIDYDEFCRRGQLRQRGVAHAGMPDFNSGPASQ